MASAAASAASASCAQPTSLLRLLSSTASTAGRIKVEPHGLVSPALASRLTRTYKRSHNIPLTYIKKRHLSSTPLVLASTNESAQLEETKKAAAAAPLATQQPIRALSDYWDPFTLSTRSLKQMMNVMDRLFNDMTTDLAGYTRTPWDIIEDEDSFRMRIDLPGFDKDEVKVSVEDGVLIVSAQHNKEEAQEDKWSRRTRGSYYTRIALPKSVETNKVAAKLSNGVLEITIPKAKKETQIVDVKLE